MATSDPSTRGVGRAVSRRRATETKEAFKTTEFIAYLVILVSILIAGLVVDGGEDGGASFGPERVWLYATLLTIGYMLSRGLAKSGSQDPFTDEH